MAATHSGHCQICGRPHKIIAGSRIATHGYTIQYGWQMGACFGSKRKPYELSNDALLEAIESAKRYIATTETAIATLKAKPLDENGMVLAEVSKKRFSERQLALVKPSIEEGKLTLRTARDEVMLPYSPLKATTVDAAARELADRRIKRLKFAIHQSQESIAYMQDRHDSWKPAELHALAPEAAPTVHYQVKRYGRTTTACSASAMGAQRNAGKHMTTDASKVTCARCAKEAARLAAKAAAAATS